MSSIVVLKGIGVGLSESDPVVHRGVAQFVVKDGVSLSKKSRECSEVRIVPAVKKQGRFRLMKSRYFLFQCFRPGRVARKQPGARGAIAKRTRSCVLELILDTASEFYGS